MEESNHLFIMIPSQNLPSRMDFPGEFSGYYTFNPWRHSRIYDNKYDTLGYYNSPECKEKNYVAHPDLDLYPRIWLNIRWKMREKDFIPVLDTSPCLIIRKDFFEYMCSQGTVSPHFESRDMELIYKGKRIIPPFPYVRISSNWDPPDVPDSVQPETWEVVNGGVLPYWIYYISHYFKDNEKYDFLPIFASKFMCSEKLVNKMLEFDPTLQFDPVYYGPIKK